MLPALLGEHLGVDVGVKGKESLSIAGRESHLGLIDADFGSSHLGGVARDEVVHGLLRVQLGHGGQHTVGVASQEDDVLGVTADGWDLDVPDMLKRVANTGVLREAKVLVVDDTLFSLSALVHGVLNDSAELDGIENIGLLGARETIGLGITATFNVEDVLICPNMLIITD